MKTIAAWQGEALETLSRNEIDSRESEVENLLSYILGLSRLELYLKTQEPVREESEKFINEAIEKRRQHMPLPYIFGEADFFSLSFHLKPGVFIPRPETEILVEEGLKIRRNFPVRLTLDLCTGSGNIALSLIKNSPGRIVAADISGLALEVAKTNAVNLGLSEEIEFIKGDLFNPLEEGYLKAFQLMVSNPPYLGLKEWVNLPPEVRSYEPREALWGGNDGLNFYRRIASEAKRFISPGGYLLLEVGEGEAVASLLEKEDWQEIKIMKDYSNRERIIKARWIK